MGMMQPWCRPGGTYCGSQKPASGREWMLGIPKRNSGNGFLEQTPWERKDPSNNGVSTKDHFQNGLSHSRSFTLGEVDVPVLKHSATGSADISGNPPKGPLNSWCLRISVGDCPKGIIDGTTTTNTWKTNDFWWIFTQWSFTPKNGLSRLRVVFHGLLTVISRSIHATHCYRTNWFKCMWGRKAWLDSFYPTRMNFKTTKFLYAMQSSSVQCQEDDSS